MNAWVCPYMEFYTNNNIYISLRGALWKFSEAKNNTVHAKLGNKLHALIATVPARPLCAALDTELVSCIGFATKTKLPLPYASRSIRWLLSWLPERL